MTLASPLTARLVRSAVAVRDLFLPPCCLGCGRDFEAIGASLTDGVQFCPDCRRELPRFEYSPCPRCLAPLPEAFGQLLECRYCLRWQPRFSRALALGPYEGLLRELLLRNKSDASGAIARALGALLWQRFAEQLQGFACDVVTAPPLHWRRRWQQGVNPQGELARQIAARLRVAVDPALLRLRHDVGRQVSLSHAGRLRNLQGEMELSRGRRLAAARVLVVDDVLTSGATCSEAARALLRAGASEVWAVVVARTPPS